jgi:putative SOS response-associated peptidase YedK
MGGLWSHYCDRWLGACRRRQPATSGGLRLMCGRAYQTYSDEELYFRYLSKRPLRPLDLLPIHNLCPTQDSPVLRLVAGERQFNKMRWQLVPATEPALRRSYRRSTLGARRSSAVRNLLVRQRCIVP